MVNAATIKLFLPLGDPKRLRTAELSNWSGMAVAAPRTDLELLLQRSELQKPGIYLLFGSDPNDGSQLAYIGEAEAVAERLKQHKTKDFWSSAVVFVSKDENLTKSHIRYLEGRLISVAKSIGRFKLTNSQSSGAKLPESDLADMGVFFERVSQLLPVLGSDLLTPITSADTNDTSTKYVCAMKGAKAIGQRTPNGFAVFKGSTAALKLRASVKKNGPWIIALRDQLIQEESLVEQNGLLLFAKDVEFSSPSAAAAVVHGGNTAGPLAWKTEEGKTLKEIESQG